MSCLHCEIQFCSFSVKLGTPRYKLKYPFRSFFNKYLYCILPAKTITRLQCILKMDSYLILITQGNSNPTLCVLGTAFSRSVFCNYKDIAMVCKLYCSPEARNPTTYDEEIHYFFYHIGRIKDAVI